MRRSFCNEHSRHAHPLPAFAPYFGTGALRVCDSCHLSLCELERSERVAWRLARAAAYLESPARLRPYFEETPRVF